MRKLIHPILTITILVSSIGFLPVIGVSGQTEPPGLPDLENPVFLPLVIKAPQNFNVSGRVTDTDDTPLAGVTITDGDGKTAMTNIHGEYSLTIKEGENALAASKQNMVFSPSPFELSVRGDLSEVNFAACHEKISNGGGTPARPH